MSENRSGENASFDPALLEVAQDGSEYILLYDDAPLKTPKGLPFKHANKRLLEHIMRDLSISRSLDVHKLGSYSLFCTQKDFVEQGQDVIAQRFRHALGYDPLLRRSAAPMVARDQVGRWTFVIDYLREIIEPPAPNAWSGAFLPVVAWSTSGSADSEEPESEEELIATNPEYFKRFVSVLQNKYEKLPAAHRTSIISLFNVDEAGVLLPMMLVIRRCSADEYAEALIVTTPIHPHVIGVGWEEYSNALEGLRADASSIIAYIDHYEGKTESIEEGAKRIEEQLRIDEIREKQRRIEEQRKIKEVQEIIQEGEGKKVEFKSTLRRHLHTQKNDPEITHAILKSVAAFLNTDGGTLLIGVGDDGSIKGIELDQFRNNDQLQRYFSDKVSEFMGKDVMALLETSFVTIEAKNVFKVFMPQSEEPVYLRQKGDEEFYVRNGAATQRCNVREAISASPPRSY